jgi:hypothetical protein
MRALAVACIAILAQQHQSSYRIVDTPLLLIVIHCDTHEVHTHVFVHYTAGRLVQILALHAPTAGGSFARVQCLSGHTAAVTAVSWASCDRCILHHH